MKITKKDFDIQNYQTAIRKFAEQTGNQLLYQALGLAETIFPNNRSDEKNQIINKIKGYLPNANGDYNVDDE